MTTPTLSIICPTLGRPELRQMLNSAVPQLLPGDEILIVGDTRLGPLPQSEAICAEFGPQVRYVEFTDNLATFGHNQINHGLTLAKGDYIHGQDDDDIYTPGSLAVMREAITAHPGRVFLFRFRSYLGGTVFWLQAGLVRQACIGGHCLVQPNIPGKVGQWGAHYEGDYTGIVDTLSRHEEPPVWCDVVICEQRPKAEELAA